MREHVDGFKEMGRIPLFNWKLIENSPQHYQKIFNKMVLQFEESMRLQLDGKGVNKSTHY